MLDLFYGDIKWIHAREGHNGKPYWPGGKSGVTLDPGVDLGYVEKPILDEYYRPLMSHDQYAEAVQVMGIKGEDARDILKQKRKLATFRITRAQARPIFEGVADKYWQKVTRRWPGIKEAPPSVQTALLSLGFNRGPGNRKLNVLDSFIKQQEWNGLARELEKMQQDHKLPGIRKRRRLEGQYILRNVDRELLSKVLTHSRLTGIDDPEAKIPWSSAVSTKFPASNEEAFYSDPAVCESSEEDHNLRLSSGTSHRVYVEESVEVLLYGKSVTFSFSEFEASSDTIRQKVVGEARLMETSLLDKFKIYDELNEGVVAWTTRLFSGQLGIGKQVERYKELSEEAGELAESISGSTIDPHELYRVGVALMNIRKEERELDGVVRDGVDKTATAAGAIAETAQVVEEVSFNVLQIGNEIYALNNPVRKALGEIVIVALRGSAHSLGNYLAYKDQKQVLRGLHGVLRSDVPPILSDLLMGSLKKCFPKGGSPIQQNLAETLVKVQIDFLFNLLMEGLQEDARFDEKMVLRAAIDTFETTLVDVIASVMGINKSDDRVRIAAFNILSQSTLILVRQYRVAREEAANSGKPLTEILVGNIPKIIIDVFKCVLRNLLSYKIEDKWGDQQSLKEDWQKEKKRMRKVFDELKEASKKKEKQKPGGNVVELRPKSDSKAVKHRGKSVGSDDEKLKQSPLPVPEVDAEVYEMKDYEHLRGKSKHPLNVKASSGKFETRGLKFEDVKDAREVTTMRRSMLEEQGLPPDVDFQKLNKNDQRKLEFVDSKLREFVESGQVLPQVEVIFKPTTFYKLVSTTKGSKKPYPTGYYLSKQTFHVIKENPSLIRSMGLPLDSINRDDGSYFVYKVEVERGARVFKNHIAPVEEDKVVNINPALRNLEQVVITQNARKKGIDDVQVKTHQATRLQEIDDNGDEQDVIIMLDYFEQQDFVSEIVEDE